MFQKGRSGNTSMVSFAPLEVPGVKWTIATRMDESEILAPMNSLIRNLLLLILGVIAVTGVLSRIAAKSLATPIRNLAAAAAGIARGDLSARADIHRKDEVGDLGESFNSMAESIEAKTRTISEKNRENEALLLNILPQPIADRLKSGEGTIADHFAEVTVLFADIVGFTVLSSKIPPGEVVDFLNNLFTRFDALAIQVGVEKIKTIGDAYMAVAGIPHPTTDHAARVAELALGIVEETRQYGQERGMDISIRVGLNSGPVVAGVIGSSKFIYDLWGDTVNVASRMESHGEAGQIQVTRPVFEALNGKYQFEPRGTIDVKGKGEIETWLMRR
jgi:class 3 adenylate cyclase